jgi:Protein of unknown function (DUF2971)
MQAAYTAALGIIDHIIQVHGLDDKKPNLLHHYTSLDAALNIIQRREIRLSHCEFLNDSTEISGAVSLINDTVTAEILKAQNQTYHRSSELFYRAVQSQYYAKSNLYEAFVFCMSEGDTTSLIGQDQLSSWRAYGRDGRGVCLSFDSAQLALYAKGGNGLRLSRVIYDPVLQRRILEEILDQGYKVHSRSNNQQDSVAATVAALVLMMPVLKHEAFEEGREWRFIFLPENQDPTTPSLKFFVRDDLMIPYYTMQQALDPANPNIDPLKAQINRTPQVSEIMLGPSGHQKLNGRSFEFLRGTAVCGSRRSPIEVSRGPECRGWIQAGLLLKPRLAAA